MSTHFARAAFVAAAIALPLTACGGGSSTSGAASSSTTADITITASNLQYDNKAYTGKAGDISIELVNNDPVQHNVTLVKDNKLIVEADPKKSHTATTNLPAGAYDVYCTIPGHNMKATITLT